jgi:23S rRNA pseudouridine2605 synthase
MEGKRLSKALAAAGVASRRAAEQMIFDGRVKVNGVVIRVPETHVHWGRDQISVDGSLIKGEEDKVYFLLNKPAGFICSNSRPSKNSRLVIDLFPGKSSRLFTIGRLDRDTTGLLLVTNDGHFANHVIHPSSGLVKEYLVKVREEVTHEHLKKLSKGALVEDHWVRPVAVFKVRRGTFKISVSEGKKHEVRIIVERAGLSLFELTRIRIGGFVLGSLQEGQYRPLTSQERALILGKSKA